jgi:hypothetical protein
MGQVFGKPPGPPPFADLPAAPAGCTGRGLFLAIRRAFSGLKKIPQPGNFDDIVCRQDGTNDASLRGCVYLIQVMLIYRLCHELPYAIVQGTVNYQIR